MFICTAAVLMLVWRIEPGLSFAKCKQKPHAQRIIYNAWKQAQHARWKRESSSRKSQNEWDDSRALHYLHCFPTGRESSPHLPLCAPCLSLWFIRRLAQPADHSTAREQCTHKSYTFGEVHVWVQYIRANVGNSVVISMLVLGVWQCVLMYSSADLCRRALPTD